jgi:hypothetical protein
MNRIYALATIALLGSVDAAVPESCEDPAADFGQRCTQARIIDADSNQDGLLDLVEIQSFIASGDHLYREAVKAVKKVAPSVSVDALMEEPLLDYSVINCVSGENCPSKWLLDDVQAYAMERNRGWRPKSTLSLPLKISRKATDPIDPRGGADLKARPFVVSYRKDDVKKEEGLQILGSIAGPPVCSLDAEPFSGDVIRNCGPVIAFDVDTVSGSRGKNKSDISFGFNTEWLFTAATTDGIDHRLVITPTYLTDADFGRDVLLVSSSYSITTPKLGGPGLYHCVGRITCGPGDWEWSWSPSLVLQAGDVRDANGNPGLEARREAGSYIRVSPTIGVRLYGWDRRAVIGLDVAYSEDVDTGVGKGYAELSYWYDISDNVALTTILRRGYKVQTLDYVDSLIFGLGFSF